MVGSKMLDDFIKIKLMAREQGEEPEAREIRGRVIDSMKFASPADHQAEEFRSWSPHVPHDLEETYSRWKKIIN